MQNNQACLEFQDLMLHKPAGGQATMTGYFAARKQPATVSIVPAPPRVGSPPVVLEVAPVAPILPLKPVHMCAGVMNNCRGKHMKPLLQCWENFGLPGENYELGYCGVDSQVSPNFCKELCQRLQCKSSK